jgi:Flp pilus assembly protein TadG
VYHFNRTRRRGSIVGLLWISLIAICLLIALAIDIGMLAVARTQAQAIADACALSGARALTGDPATDYNRAAVDPAVQQVLAEAKVLGQGMSTVLDDGNPKTTVTTQVGSYRYDDSTNQFIQSDTRTSTDEAWTMVRATVNTRNRTTFGRVAGLAELGATAVAVRPSGTGPTSAAGAAPAPRRRSTPPPASRSARRTSPRTPTRAPPSSTTSSRTARRSAPRRRRSPPSPPATPPRPAG